jgi:hypothetical protein
MRSSGRRALDGEAAVGTCGGGRRVLDGEAVVGDAAAADVQAGSECCGCALRSIGIRW